MLSNNAVFVMVVVYSGCQIELDAWEINLDKKYMSFAFIFLKMPIISKHGSFLLRGNVYSARNGQNLKDSCDKHCTYSFGREELLPPICNHNKPGGSPSYSK